MAEPRRIQAAGALVWRHGQEETEVLLVHRPKHDDWSLAKGKQDAGEHLVQTAVREVFEETGLRPVLGRRLRTVGYEVNGSPKWVHYWAAASPAAPPAADGPRSPSRPDTAAAAGGQGEGATGGDGTPDAAGRAGAVAPTDAHAAITPWFSPNHEVDRVEWLPLSRARERLSYARDAWVLGAFARWPRETIPLILLRHAPAGNKKNWPGDDLERPLDEAGRAGARALAGVLACFAPRRVISSPAARCLQTVQPYAAQIGVPVEAEAAFLPPARARESSENSSRITAGDPGATMKRIVAGAEPTVVCVHRENIPALLAAACEELGSRPPAQVSVPKSGFWALHIGGAELTAIERYTLPAG